MRTLDFTGSFEIPVGISLADGINRLAIRLRQLVNDEPVAPGSIDFKDLSIDIRISEDV